jgi:hypothetical protein
LGRPRLVVDLTLPQRFFQYKNSVFQRLELNLVVVLPMFLVKMLCNVTHHDHSNGEEATLGGAIAMQTMVKPRVDVGELLCAQNQV